MTKKIDETLFDKRIVERYLKKGVVARDDYTDFLKNLPDESKNADYIEAAQEDGLLTFSSVEKVRA